MDLDDPRWSGLRGGYGAPYDPRPALARLAEGQAKSAWEELWQELHHQGDVGEASYAAVLELTRVHAARGVPDWNTYALAATIEEARLSGRNAPLPAWMQADYAAAWRQLQVLALADLPTANDDELIHSILAVLAHSKGKTAMGRMALLTEEERQEMLDQAGWG